MLASSILLAFTCFWVVAIAIVVIARTSPESTTNRYYYGPALPFAIDAPTLNIKGRVPPIVNKAGRRAYEVLFKKGMRLSSGANCSMSMKPRGLLPTTSLRWRFKIWFDDNFPWVQTSTHNVGGKLGGFEIGEGKASGGYYSDQAATYRLIFTKNQGAEGYLYPQVRRSFTSQATWADVDQSPEFQRISHISLGIAVFESDNESKLRFKMGDWNVVELYTKLNTPGKFDGVMELVVNGNRQRSDSVRYRYSDILITNVTLQPFFGGGNDTFAPPTDVRVWYADFEFSN